MSKISEENKVSILKALIQKSKKYELSKMPREKAQEDAFKYLSTTIEKCIKTDNKN
ncbi:hypothetical protein OA493_02165 [Gammaproteobacteria bacterium]|nr:hypothetical protein [Gammaproteobacteria bacterium]